MEETKVINWITKDRTGWVLWDKAPHWNVDIEVWTSAVGVESHWTLLSDMVVELLMGYSFNEYIAEKVLIQLV